MSADKITIETDKILQKYAGRLDRFQKASAEAHDEGDWARYNELSSAITQLEEIVQDLERTKALLGS